VEIAKTATSVAFYLIASPLGSLSRRRSNPFKNLHLPTQVYLEEGCGNCKNSHVSGFLFDSIPPGIAEPQAKQSLFPLNVIRDLQNSQR
jgi:hypothetical protein